jgi:hypothetical protein
MKKYRIHLSFLSLIGLLAAGCGPAKVPTTVEIQPNETVWVIPMDALGGDQAKFNSVDYLEKRKVAAKRVWVDKVIRSTGRMWFDYEWIDAVRVITVDRSLISREWTVDHQGIPVVTRDSVQLTVGLTVTANIEEDDASTYLYYHGAKKLVDVVDSNVRSYAVAELTRQYSQMGLAEAQTNGTLIYSKLSEDAKTFFKTKGITIQYLGNAEGWRYENPKIQESINANYIAEQDNKTALNQQTAQDVRNKTKVNIAQAEADAANKLFAAQEATKFQVALQVQTMEAQARLSMATNWNGKLPENILPEGSPLLMNLGASAKVPATAQK